MTQQIRGFALLVREYDDAIAYFTDVLGFVLLEDTRLDAAKRWVRVAPRGGRGTELLLARASTPAQVAQIGHQFGGRVGLFLHTDDFAGDFARWTAAGVRFVEAPRHEPYGTVVVFEDLFGNRWDLVEPRKVPAAPRPDASGDGDPRQFLIRQFDTAWSLTQHHLDGLSTEECLWRPGPTGMHVHRQSNGEWHAEWPAHERYELGPPSIAWLTWHLGFWWSMALDQSFGDGLLTREGVTWPGGAEAVREWIGRLHDDWRVRLHEVTDRDLRSNARTRWPFRDRPFGDVVAWANLELMKNAAEIGYARFLFAAGR